MPGTFGSQEARRHWRPHELTSFCLRALVVVSSLVVCAGVGIVVGWSVPGDSPLDILARVLAAGLASVATAVVFESLSRRLMPLTALLRMSLAFPDHAPSRFAIAMRSTSVRRLREWACANEDRMDAQALSEKVLTLASALNFHDRRTRGHSERTRALAELVVEEMGLSPQDANEVRWGAFLHDIGKLLVPSAVLNKAGTLSDSEWDQVREHPAAGGRLVRPLRPFIGSGVEAVACHHESFDGTGYPNGLRGDEIALAARIVAVVDSFEVMTAVRSYKRPMSSGAARRELVKEAGKQFDPHVVRAFLNVSLGRLHWSLGLVAWVAQLPFVGVIPRAAAQVGAAVGAGSSAVTTATLASVATASLGASLVMSPIASNPSLAAAAEAPASSVPAVGASTGAPAGPSDAPAGTHSTMARVQISRQHKGTRGAVVPTSTTVASATSQRPTDPSTASGNGSTNAAGAAKFGSTGGAVTYSTPAVASSTPATTAPPSASQQTVPPGPGGHGRSGTAGPGHGHGGPPAPPARSGTASAGTSSSGAAAASKTADGGGHGSLATSPGRSGSAGQGLGHGASGASGHSGTATSGTASSGTSASGTGTSGTATPGPVAPSGTTEGGGHGGPVTPPGRSSTGGHPGTAGTTGRGHGGHGSPGKH